MRLLRIYEKLYMLDGMLQQIDIPCGQGSDAYLVSIIGKNLRDIFAEASEHPALKGKEGEARVEAILALGNVSKVVRRKDGKFNDGPQGEPAILMFNPNGTLHAIRHFRDGKLHDSANGLAARQFDYPDGNKLVYAASFVKGKRIKCLTEQEMAARPVCDKKSYTRPKGSGPKAA